MLLKLAIFSGQRTCAYLLRLSGDHPGLIVNIFKFGLQLFRKLKGFMTRRQNVFKTYTGNTFFGVSKIYFLFYFEIIFAIVSVDCELFNSVNFKGI